MKFRDLAERQILKAQAEGQLDDLKGGGKPLPPPGHGDFAEAAGFRIMAEAGAVPKEIELKKALKAKAQELQSLTDPAARKHAMAQFAAIQQELHTQEEARRKYFGA